MNSKTGALRCIVIGINTLYLLAGFAAVAVGLWLFFTRYEVWKFGEFAEYSESESLRNFWVADVIFISGGVAVIVFGFSGVCGVFARNSCMWGFQAFCFLLTIGVHIAALVFVVQSYMQHERTQTPMRNELFEKYDGVGTNGYTQWFNEVQKKYECCGVSGVIDYTADVSSFDLFSSSKGTLRSMPPRTCMDEDKGIAYGTGCHEGMTGALYVEYLSILIISSVTIFCALLLFALSICLCVRYKEEAIVTHL